jgi:hypothetical protein
MTAPRFTTILLAFAFTALPAIAKPNFSGDWKLNTSKSAFGQMPPPSSMTSQIAHEDPKLKNSVKQSSERGDFESESTYTTDGKECTNQMFGNPVTSTLKWDGEVLVIESKAKIGESEFTMQDKWSLSGDGKTLTIVRHYKNSMGEGEQKLVLEKQ